MQGFLNALMIVGFLGGVWWLYWLWLGFMYGDIEQTPKQRRRFLLNAGGEVERITERTLRDMNRLTDPKYRVR